MSEDVFAALGHRALSLQHAVTMAMARRRGDLALAVVPGVAKLTDGGPLPSGDLAELRRLTHDRVIAMTGPGRLTGVSWIQSTGDAAVELLRGMDTDSSGGPIPPLAIPHDELPAMIAALEADPVDAVLVCAIVLADARSSRAVLS